MPDNITQPAIDELYKAYDELIPWVMKELSQSTFREWDDSGNYGEKPVPLPQKPVIRIEPKGKRTNKSWVNLDSWETDIDEAMAVITNNKAVKRDEIVLITELFDDTPEQVLIELLKQLPHISSKNYGLQRGSWQAPTISKNNNTNTNYVTKEYEYEIARIGFEKTGKRNQDVSLSASRHSNKAEATMTKIKEVLDKLDTDAFSIKRAGKQNRSNQLAAMKKWQCSCTNIRTTTFVDISCKLCGEKFSYADKDKDDQVTIDHLAAEEKRLVSGSFAVSEMAHRKRVLRFFP